MLQRYLDQDHQCKEARSFHGERPLARIGKGSSIFASPRLPRLTLFDVGAGELVSTLARVNISCFLNLGSGEEVV